MDDTQIRLFGKPDLEGERRLGVTLAQGESIEEARSRASAASQKIRIQVN